MPKRIGLDPKVRGDSERILVKALLRNPFAAARMKKIAKQFPEMVDMPLMKYPPFHESPATDAKPPEYPIEEHIPAKIDKARVEEYALELRKLADDYGLRCDWIIGNLHIQIRRMIDPRSRFFDVVAFTTPVIDEFIVHVPISPETRKNDVLRQVDKEWQRVAVNPEFRQRIKPPLNLNDAVEFLGLRLISKWTPERIMEWHNYNHPPPHYLLSDIEAVIRKAAKLLDIKLPRKRPRKAKNI
jgi:hypothetical protein